MMNGGSVKLDHDQLHGHHILHLSARQFKKLGESRESGKGMRLKLSKAQVMHNVKGGGIFSSLWTAAKGAAKTILPKLARAAVEKLKDAAPSLIQAGIGKLAGVASEHIGAENAGRAAEFAKKWAAKGTEAAYGKADEELKKRGAGISRKRKTKATA